MVKRLNLSELVNGLTRALQTALQQALARSPAVALLGPGQVGKTTLAFALAESQLSTYLDLQSERDRAKLAEPELYLADHQDKLVILDEIHQLPNLFPVLRGLIDQSRRNGRKTGCYLLLGSASLDLVQHSSESLAGRISYLELTPFCLLELTANDAGRLWVRGGFPESYLSASDADSFAWRLDFIRSYLERDIPQFGPRISADALRRFWGHACTPARRLTQRRVVGAQFRRRPESGRALS